MLEGDQAVIKALVELPVLQRVVDLRIDRAARRGGDGAVREVCDLLLAAR